MVRKIVRNKMLRIDAGPLKCRLSHAAFRPGAFYFFSRTSSSFTAPSGSLSFCDAG
jgi:hypothetical protein